MFLCSKEFRLKTHSGHSLFRNRSSTELRSAKRPLTQHFLCHI